MILLDDQDQRCWRSMHDNCSARWPYYNSGCTRVRFPAFATFPLVPLLAMVFISLLVDDIWLKQAERVQLKDVQAQRERAGFSHVRRLGGRDQAPGPVAHFLGSLIGAQQAALHQGTPLDLPNCSQRLSRKLLQLAIRSLILLVFPSPLQLPTCLPRGILQIASAGRDELLLV